MKKFSLLLAVLCSLSCLKAQPYQLKNSDFEKWDSVSNTLSPVGWNSYFNANCDIKAMPSYSSMICNIITNTIVHFRSEGSRTGSDGKYYLTLKSLNVSGPGINMIVSGLMSTNRFNIGDINVYTPLNYFETDRQDSNFCQVLRATPDSLCFWAKYYAPDADSSRARVVAYIHGDNDFQYMNDIKDSNKFTACINYLIPRTDSAAPAQNWQYFQLPFNYVGKAEPKYIFLYAASDSCIIGGNMGNEFSIDDIKLVYSSWLTDIQIDGKSLEDFKKSNLTYNCYYESGIPTDHIPVITYSKEVEDIYDTLVYTPSQSGLHGAKAEIRLRAEDGISSHTYTVNFFIGKDSNSLENFASEEQFRFYPNPASSRFYMSLPENDINSEFKLYTIDGRCVIKKKVTNINSSVSIDDIAEGTYLYTLCKNGKILYKGNLVKH